MSITTRSGDSGYTHLRRGRRVRKDDMRIEACGALDELSAFLGLAKVSARRKWVKTLIQSCQEDLIVVGAELAGLPLDTTQLEKKAYADMVRRLEDALQDLGKRAQPMPSTFVVYGETRTSALLDVSRSIARRAERRVVKIRRRMAVPREILVYLNRLSDVLYLLARYEAKRRRQQDA